MHQSSMNRFLFILIANIIGVMIVVALTIKIFKADISSGANSIVSKINGAIDEVDAIYNDHFKSIEMPDNCEVFRERATLAVFDSSIIRSVSWLNENLVECTSLSKEKLVISDYIDKYHINKFLYLSESPYSNKSNNADKGVLLVSYNVEEKISVIFGVHPGNIKGLLKFKDGFADFTVLIGGHYFKYDSILDVDTNLYGFYQVYSNDFYKVYANYKLIDYFSFVIENYGLFFLLWIVFCNFGANFIFSKFSIYGIMWFKIDNALKNKDFHPYLQPIFDRNLNLMGAEVLVRWIDKNNKFIFPDKFISIAEKNGQINEITEMLMEKLAFSFNSISIIRKAPLHISFNIVPSQIINEDFFNYCVQYFDSLSKSDYTFILELTEREEIPNEKKYIDAVNAFKSLGFKIALDDFGTGHCSLKYLLQMDVDYIKIDKSYVASIDSGYKMELLDNIIDLSKNLAISTIAEGVESKKELDYLLSKNVDNFQGYIFEKPMPIDEFIRVYILQRDA
ncbi:diguanylate cyclase/phosphodiesterase with PAS/PAC sensor(s) [Vibrio cholerae]|uniref:EAL domain-containing protein n=1 Tax=Vibrio paracholerae TaxID=650003 RepID=UPI0004980B4C|nr:EAL domain-containing protein [Vibrio paracholerae]GHX36388.1 diguanylate cyclase/phosphodiesterase with PAS/PAC sensor(s) [Vibrio cholerae]